MQKAIAGIKETTAADYAAWLEKVAAAGTAHHAPAALVIRTVGRTRRRDWGLGVARGHRQAAQAC
ncbi:hypothetical protein ACDL62_04670 [Corynebacterium diphtheriae]|uniref:hypothetical protein n=1 Tax=Corynebacterium diphtheriae TaxID=1717 RepID=UPI000245BD11|nr:hypothetical protein [Corynebacterium diphtheriae]AEX49559.1 hypothetical protein CDBH8_2042 [Corynebacterium diphtheriae BH8]AEX79695.1 hypothetical protein CDHC03_1968 [Corynebacterium diphtheriae HC03]MBG9247253.1 hypothetical protein [Corynebacterium diphtheriae bv. mitis]MBG9257837.1 hypothetical protein [Corynebacterium diphtheriae bv. mitis]MBG9291002.1 hypothetical protein [Corynebacterium diphtheriae bv. gravis]